MKDRTRLIDKRYAELDLGETNLRSLEKKRIGDQINFETDNQRNADYTKQRNSHQAATPLFKAMPCVRNIWQVKHLIRSSTLSHRIAQNGCNKKCSIRFSH
jgi:hypothetical protein